MLGLYCSSVFPWNNWAQKVNALTLKLSGFSYNALNLFSLFGYNGLSFPSCSGQVSQGLKCKKITRIMNRKAF